MTTDDFTTAARTESERLAPTPEDGDRFHVWNTRDMRDHGVEMAAWARTYLAEQEPTEDDVQAAVAAILALTDETEETARMDDIDVAWDHARAALTAARAVGRDAR